MEASTQELLEWSARLIAQDRPYEASRPLTSAEVEWLCATHARLASMPRGDAELHLDVTKQLVSCVWKCRPLRTDHLPVQWTITSIASLHAATETAHVDLDRPSSANASPLVCAYLDSTQLCVRGKLALQDATASIAAEWCVPDVALMHKLVLLTKFSLVCPTPHASRTRSLNYLQVTACTELARPMLRGVPPMPPALQYWLSDEQPVLSVAQLVARPALHATKLLHLCGSVAAVSPLIDFSSAQPPFFLVEVRDERDFAVHVLFSGESAVAWHSFVQCGEPHLLTNLKAAVLFKNKPTELRVLRASPPNGRAERSTFVYQLTAPQAKLLIAGGANGGGGSGGGGGGQGSGARMRPDPAIELASPSKRHKNNATSAASPASLSPRRRARQRLTDVVLSATSTVSYSGVISACYDGTHYVLDDDDLRLYLSHSNCRPYGRGLVVGAHVLVRNAHPVFDSTGRLRALGCCSRRCAGVLRRTAERPLFFSLAPLVALKLKSLHPLAVSGNRSLKEPGMILLSKSLCRVITCTRTTLPPSLTPLPPKTGRHC